MCRNSLLVSIMSLHLKGSRQLLVQHHLSGLVIVEIGAKEIGGEILVSHSILCITMLGWPQVVPNTIPSIQSPQIGVFQNK